MKLPDFEAWAIFASVVEHRSFSAAAAALGTSKATVSKAVSRLEVQLGQSLFHRTSRRLTLTDSGKSLAERAQRLLAEGEAAEEAARDAASALSGSIRVAAPMSFGLLHLAPVIAEFLADHPGISIELHLSDARTDIVAEGFDIALRIARLPDSSLRARRLATVTMRVVASPAYLEHHGLPVHPGQLGDHPCFTYTNNDEPWRFTGPEGADIATRPAGPLSVNSGEAMLPALRAGLGIAILPDFIVDGDLERGTLVAILENWSAPPTALHLLTPPGKLRPVRVETLISFLDQHLRNVCARERNRDENKRLAHLPRLTGN